MPYPMPGYLEHPADLAGNLLSGYRAGATVAGEQAKLQAEADQTSVKLAEQERQNQRQQARQQQMLEMTRAYHEQTLNVRKMQLQAAQERVNLATQAAARKFAAQTGWTQRVQQLGGNQDAIRQATMEFGPGFMTGTEMTGALKPPVTPAQWHPASSEPGGPPGYFQQPSGAALVPSAAGDTTLRDLHQQYTEDYRRFEDRWKNMRDVLQMAKTKDPHELPPQMLDQLREYEADKASLDSLREERDRQIGYRHATLPPSMSTAPSAHPASKVERANALRREHPEWSREQIIRAVNAGQ